MSYLFVYSVVVNSCFITVRNHMNITSLKELVLTYFGWFL